MFAGFLATTGVFLLIGGFQVALNDHTIRTFAGFFDSAIALRWSPMLALAVLIVVATRVLTGDFVLPVMLLVALAALYLIYGAMGYALPDMREAGLLLGPFEADSVLATLDPQLPYQVDLSAVLWHAPTVLTIAVSSVVGATLNVSGLELALNKEADINKDLRGVGLSNIGSGLFGGIPGYHFVGETLLAQRLGLSGAVPCLSAAAGCLVLAIVGVDALSVIPVAFLAAIIAYLGIDLIYTWLWVERHRFDRLDYLVVLAIPAAALLFGFLTAIAIGLMLACMAFIYIYSRLDFVRSETDLTTRRSKVERPQVQIDHLAAVGHCAKVMELAGYLFFGSSNILRERIGQLLKSSADLKWLIIDFTNVSGLDVSTGQILQRLAVDCRLAEVHLIGTGLETAPDNAFACFATVSEGIAHVEDALLQGHLQDITYPDGELSDLMRHGDFVACTSVVTLAGGETLWSESTDARDLFYLLDGELVVTAQEAKGGLIALVQPGSYVGELSAYTGAARSAEVHAKGGARLLQLHADALDRLEEQNPQLALRFHKSLAATIADRLVRTTRFLNHVGA